MQQSYVFHLLWRQPASIGERALAEHRCVEFDDGEVCVEEWEKRQDALRVTERFVFKDGESEIVEA